MIHQVNISVIEITSSSQANKKNNDWKKQIEMHTISMPCFMIRHDTLPWILQPCISSQISEVAKANINLLGQVLRPPSHPYTLKPMIKDDKEVGARSLAGAD